MFKKKQSGNGFTYNGKDERFVVRGGIAQPLDANGETADGKYLPHTGLEVVVLPAKLTWKPRRIVLYPENSGRPFPIAGAVLLPDSLKAQDLKTLYGPYPPSVIRRAFSNLVEEFEKFRLKDWIIIAIGGATCAGAWLAAIYAYKLWKIVVS